jgi:hypothetical protein
MTDTADLQPRGALMVHGEQLLLLRDMFATQQVDVFLYDTSMSELLEDAWKPWARRMRPHTKHISGRLIVCAPACIFPDPHNHGTIRATLAQQIQAVCDVAITLDAYGIFLPIEAATTEFQERIVHYLAPLHERITAQAMQLIVHAGMGSNVGALRHMIEAFTPAIHLCNKNDDDDLQCTYQWWHDTPAIRHTPTPIMGPFAEVNTYRTTIQQWRTHHATPADTAPAETESEETAPDDIASEETA